LLAYRGRDPLPRRPLNPDMVTERQTNAPDSSPFLERNSEKKHCKAGG